MICVEVHSNNVITVRDVSLKGAVSDSVKHETVKFLFSDNWKNYQKTAVFSADGVEPINIVLDKDNPLCLSESECYIPFEVLKADCFTLSVFGVNGDSLATATNTQIEVLASGYALGDRPATPTPSEYSQIITIMNETKEIAQSASGGENSGVTKNYVNQRFANAVRVTKSGSAVILENVSPIEHEIKINLTSDTLTDFTGVTVEVYDTDNTLLQTVSANAYGIVTGIVSKSPNMLICTDSDSVIIEAEYITDTKAYIDSLQATGDTLQQANTYTDEQIDSLKSEIDETAVFKAGLKALLLDAEHPVGSVYIASDAATDPSVLFGGTWELIDKEFTNTSRADTASKGEMFTVSANVSDYEIYAIYGGHTIRLRLAFTPSVALDSDSTVEIGDFVLDKIGVNGFYHSLLGLPALGDGANGLVMANINNSGNVVVNDIVKSASANQTLYINKEITCRFESMLDSFCDKFYWKRIA